MQSFQALTRGLQRGGGVHEGRGHNKMTPVIFQGVRGQGTLWLFSCALHMSGKNAVVFCDCENENIKNSFAEPRGFCRLGILGGLGEVL